MKNTAKIIVALMLAVVPATKASTLISYDIGEMTSGGATISSGSLFFISWGTDNSFDSGTFSNGATGLVKSTDSILFAAAISSGVAQSSWTEYLNSPVAAGQKFTALFVNGLTSSDVDYTTGAFTGGKTIGLTGGTSYSFGTYRTDSVESFGNTVSDEIAWVLPATTVPTAALNAYSNTGGYAGGSIAASLATTSNFNLVGSVVAVPEPSVASLFALGTVGLVALRARRKS